jgi:hypothetical protein
MTTEELLARADACAAAYGHEPDALVRDLAASLREMQRNWFASNKAIERAEAALVTLRARHGEQHVLECLEREVALAEARQEAGFWKRGKLIADEALAEALGLLERLTVWAEWMKKRYRTPEMGQPNTGAPAEARAFLAHRHEVKTWGGIIAPGDTAAVERMRARCRETCGTHHGEEHDHTGTGLYAPIGPPAPTLEKP